jgi:hypothetical protein
MAGKNPQTGPVPPSDEVATHAFIDKIEIVNLGNDRAIGVVPTPDVPTIPVTVDRAVYGNDPVNLLSLLARHHIAHSESALRSVILGDIKMDELAAREDFKSEFGQ